MTTGWEPALGQYPYPPPNVQVMSPMFTGAIDIRWDDPAFISTVSSALAQASVRLVVSGAVGSVNTLQPAMGTIDVDSSPIPAGETITINGVILTAVSGARTPGSNDFDGSGSTADIATDIATALLDGANDFSEIVTAAAVGSQVILTAVTAGSDGNDITLATSSSDLTLSGSTLADGTDADTITIGGVVTLTAEDGARTAGGLNFDVTLDTFGIAENIAAAINDEDNLLSALVTATASYGVVTFTAVPQGVAGNSITVASTSSYLTFSADTLSGGVGVRGADDRSNSVWTIVGVNIYRSDTGERGPYFRLNDLPVGTMFFRDRTDNTPITEVVDWDSGWASRGDATNDRRWTIRTQRSPIVKPDGQAIHANSSGDVTVTIDGVRATVASVFGPTGEITLVNTPMWDLSKEIYIQPVLPNADGTSEVVVTYRYNRNLVKTTLENKAKTFYRLTTVAVDPSTPSGLIETPLGWSPPVNVHAVETLDYMWRRAISMNSFILQQGGERVKLFIRRTNGIPCNCRRRDPLREFLKQPVNQGQINPLCPTCYGTGYLNGYEGPIDIIIAPDDAERRISQGPTGRRLDHQYEVWTGPSPMLTQRDFIVKQTGERYTIGPVRRPAVKGLPLQQHFNIQYIDEGDIRYRVPVTGATGDPWPEDRYTDPNTVAKPGDPHPVGFDHQATPMTTEHDGIPDGREQRGRTPAWKNTTYALHIGVLVGWIAYVATLWCGL